MFAHLSEKGSIANLSTKVAAAASLAQGLGLFPAIFAVLLASFLFPVAVLHSWLHSGQSSVQNNFPFFPFFFSFVQNNFPCPQKIAIFA